MFYTLINMNATYQLYLELKERLAKFQDGRWKTDESMQNMSVEEATQLTEKIARMVQECKESGFDQLAEDYRIRIN